MKPIRKTIIVFLAGIVMLAPIFVAPAFSQTSEELEMELERIQTQITEYENELSKTKTEKQTLANKISQLKKEQEKISLQIKSTNIQINALDHQLSATKDSIQETIEKIGRLKEQIVEIVRIINKQDRMPIIRVFLESDGFSEFSAEIEALAWVSGSLVSTVDEVTTAKAELEKQRADLETEMEEKNDFLSIQNLQRLDLQGKTSEQNRILKETKGRESDYQKMLSDSQKRAQEIKNRIYELLGVSAQISFGEAVEIANWASRLTGVRPALLLAVLTQESNLGKNVGTCNRPGDPPSKSWQVVMKPERDQQPFLAITAELGMNPDVTPVSCPMRDSNGNQIGWGGAMGPAQFIPSTWMGYKNRVTTVTGNPTANPWDIRDAFIAAGILLKSNGAVSGNEDSEWRAAMRYFCGSTNTRFRFYGDSIIALARQYEEDIKALE
jgi:peptidoglycan hydrolase CwlO-like protein